MKRFLVILFLIMTAYSNQSSGQQQLAGAYNHSSKGDPQGGSYLFLLENGKFVITFFGGVVKGNWTVSGDRVNFKPDAPEERFYLYGRHNKDLGDSCRMFFRGFDDVATFIGFEQPATELPVLRRVFNEGSNCYTYPYVHKFPHKIPEVVFADRPYGYQEEQSNGEPFPDAYQFSNPEGFNDFVVYYVKENRDLRPFFAKIEGEQLLFGEHDASKREPLPTGGENLDFITEVAALPKSDKEVFYSPQYNQASVKMKEDTLNWRFDAKKNAYLNIYNYEEGEEYRPKEEADYNRPNVYYSFIELPVAAKMPLKFKVEGKPLFVANCDDEVESPLQESAEE